MSNCNSIGQSSQCFELRLPIHWDSTVNPSQMSPQSLAYLGDAVYELWMRTVFFVPPKRISVYHEQVVNQVKAESQADCLNYLYPYLTTQEQDIVRRGRNAATHKPKRLSLEIYQQATSLETLIGYLYLQDPMRLAELFSKIVLKDQDS